MHSVEPILPKQESAASKPAGADAPASAPVAALAQRAPGAAATPAAAAAAPKAAAPSAPAPALPRGVAMMSRAISFNSTLTKRFPAALPATGPVAGANHPQQTRAAQRPEIAMERGAAGSGGGTAAAIAAAAGGEGGGVGGPLTIAAVPGQSLGALEALKPATPGAARPPTIVRVDAAPGFGAEPSPEATQGSGTAAAAAVAECDSEREGSGFIKAGHQSQQLDTPAAGEQGEGGAGLTFIALLEQKLSAATQGAAPAGAGAGGGGNVHAGWGRPEGVGVGGIASMEAPSLATLLTPAAGAPSRHFSGTKFLRAFGKKLSLGYAKAPRASAADLVGLGR